MAVDYIKYRRSEIMNRENQELYHQFLRDLSESEDSVDKLREALSVKNHSRMKRRMNLSCMH